MICRKVTLSDVLPYRIASIVRSQGLETDTVCNIATGNGRIGDGGEHLIPAFSRGTSHQAWRLKGICAEVARRRIVCFEVGEGRHHCSRWVRSRMCLRVTEPTIGRYIDELATWDFSILHARQWM